MAATVKTVNGLALANMKTWDGLAAASVKTILGQDAQSGGGWTPNSEASLVNWYDGSTLGLSNGATVSTWTDSKTGNPNPMTSTGGFNPTYATNQQNSLGTVALNGSQILETGGSASNVLPRTIAIVLQIPNINSQYRFLGSEISSGGMEIFVYSSGDGGLAGKIAVNNTGVATLANSTGTLPTGAYHLVTMTLSTTAYEFFLDGVSIGSGSGSFSLGAGGTFVLGGRTFFGGPNGAMVGNLAEVQIYNTVLDSTALGNLTSYIQTKWATP